MKTLGNSCRKLAVAAAVAAALGVAAPATADPIQLGFILDSSGSIGSGNWNTIVNGLGNAINALIPANSSYEVSVVTFSSTASTIVNHVLIDNATTRTNVANAVQAAPFLNANTNFNLAFSTMQTALTSTTNCPQGLCATSYVNFATDGVPNEGGGEAGGVTARNNIIAAGVDNISIEAIGSGPNAAYLQNSICYPLACDTTQPFNFPGQGFYIQIANAGEYQRAITTKIQTVVGTPEPATLALFGVGLAGLFGFGRRKAA